jgi:hypothetical protein
MAQLAPPHIPPRLALDDGDGLARMHFRLWQWWVSMLTIFATAWLFSLGWIPGIIGIITAKHILVAVFVMGIGVDSPREAET